MRINKYIAECGITSRRGADELIRQGKVSVNGKIISELGLDINPDVDKVIVDGRKIRHTSKHVYIMFYKPKGCICSASDEHGRKTVYDYLNINQKLAIVGRLDYDSEGLLLLTNDGEMVNKLTHPSNMVPKTYLVKTEGEFTDDEIKKLKGKVDIGEGEETSGASVQLLEKSDGKSKLRITIREGKNREIRRMCESLNKNVIFLKRIEIAGVRLGGLARGTYRYLTPKEIELLRKA